ncbi:MAG TPA: efflux RND transporter periplasmic adaptor subunit [Candidatus Omnitrophota bacterium]|nr:efflux RND transporter periplasmic adaptor subunit [Candidatus Omnitrophota bacterium]
MNFIKRYGMILLVLLAVIFAVKFFFFKESDGPQLEVLRKVKVKSGDLLITFSATGEVKPYNRVEMKPPIAGRVEEVLVQEGDMVVKGQILAWMSSTERAALLDSARSKGEAVYREWESAYKPAPLMAPLDGKIIARKVEPGQTVTTADPIVVISDRLIVEVLVDETDLALVELGQNAQIQLDAYRGNVLLGKVAHISYESQLINNVNVYTIDVLPDEIPDVFRSGMTAGVTFFIKDIKNTLLVPSEAIAEMPRKMKEKTDGQFVVYKKELRGLKPIPVEIGESDGEMTQILKGVSVGEEILVVRRKQKKSGGSALSPTGGNRSASGAPRNR